MVESLYKEQIWLQPTINKSCSSFLKLKNKLRRTWSSFRLCHRLCFFSLLWNEGDFPTTVAIGVGDQSRPWPKWPLRGDAQLKESWAVTCCANKIGLRPSMAVGLSWGVHTNLSGCLEMQAAKGNSELCCSKDNRSSTVYVPTSLLACNIEHYIHQETWFSV